MMGQFKLKQRGTFSQDAAREAVLQPGGDSCSLLLAREPREASWQPNKPRREHSPLLLARFPRSEFSTDVRSSKEAQLYLYF
uniref:Uncharacterized protein n=1 Tax=Sphaerodactylus townsendi TaxID=933632 RepID=A0ACB8EPQ5_9SAUR